MNVVLLFQPAMVPAKNAERARAKNSIAIWENRFEFLSESDQSEKISTDIGIRLRGGPWSRERLIRDPG
jgi:hypothetical protein